MVDTRKVAIVTGASQGIGAALVEAFRKRGYNVVANSRHITEANPFATSANLGLVDGDIGDATTAAKIADTAISKFGRIDVLINNAGMFVPKAFTEYTTEDFDALVSTTLAGFLYVSQLAVKQMLKQKSGSIVNISTTLVDHPVAGVPVTVQVMAKGSLDAVTRALAMEYASDGIRVNIVALGVAVGRHRFRGQDVEHPEIDLAAACWASEDRRERTTDALGRRDDRRFGALASGDALRPGQRLDFRQPTHARPTAFVARGAHANLYRFCRHTRRHHQAHQLARVSAHVFNLAGRERRGGEGGGEDGAVAVATCKPIDHDGYLHARREQQETRGAKPGGGNGFAEGPECIGRGRRRRYGLMCTFLCTTLCTTPLQQFQLSC